MTKSTECPVSARKFKNSPVRSSKDSLRGVYWICWAEALTKIERDWLKANCHVDDDTWIFYLTAKEYSKIYG